MKEGGETFARQQKKKELEKKKKIFVELENLREEITLNLDFSQYLHTFFSHHQKAYSFYL